jgi:hypothetical protein
MKEKYNKMDYAYGVKSRIETGIAFPLEGLKERVTDTSDSFWLILIYDRKLSWSERRKYNLEYLCKVAEK